MATLTGASIMSVGPSSGIGGDSNGGFPGAGTTTVAFIMDENIMDNNGSGELSSSGGSIGGGISSTSDGGLLNLAADDLFRDYDLGLTQLAAVFCVIFIIVGVPGNLITIIALARCKKVSILFCGFSFSRFYSFIYSTVFCVSRVSAGFQSIHKNL